jgi:two-component system sensor histidine kinase PilS (NtrC family)
MFLTGASLLTNYLHSGRALEIDLVVLLLLHYASLAGAWLAERSLAPRTWLVAAQLGFDTLLIAILIHLSGGPHSAFPALHCLTIVLAASYLGGRAALVLAAAAAIFTGGAHAGLALGWWISGAAGELEYTGGKEVMLTLTHVGLFLVVGAVGGELARRTAQRRRLQERAAQQVHRTRLEVRHILDNLSSGLVTVDPTGKVTRINPAACRLLSLDAEKTIGQPLQLALGEGGEELAAAIRAVAAGGSPLRRAELRIRRRDYELPLGVSVNYLEDSDRAICGAVAIFTDLTEVTRMREHLRKADRLAGIGELAASIAHEIRNPLGSIRGSVEILVSELQLEGYQAQLLELILKESERVNTIITDFLRFARLRPPEPRRVRGADFLADVALQVQQDIRAHGGAVDLVCDCAPDDLEFEIDAEQMIQLLLNLALNACEAMTYSGRLRITAATGGDGGWCVLRVADTGPGIDAAICERMFDPFQTTKKDGTGLGLPMVARIAHAHGGTIEAENGDEGGAVFTVRLPQGGSAERGTRDSAIAADAKAVVPA